MKTDQKEEAKELYIQTDLSKTEIASRIGVDRRTVLLWSKQNNWDKLRASARHLPSIVAEKCYYLINGFADRLLIDGTPSSLNIKHAQTIHLLATSIKKLKNRSTVNESMEMFGFFLDGLKRRDPDLAAAILPEVEQYIQVRENQDISDFLFDGVNADGTMPYPEKEIEETRQDNNDMADLAREFQEFVAARGRNSNVAQQADTNTGTMNHEPNNTTQEYRNKAA